MNLKETFVPPLSQILTGLFHMKKRYSVWREKGTQDWLVIYTKGGRGRFGYEDGEFLTREGDITLLRPHVRHDYGLETKFKRWDLLWAHFIPRADYYKLLDWPEKAPGIMQLYIEDVAIRKKIAGRFLEANKLASGHLAQREWFAMNALEEVLLWCDQINPKSKTKQFDSRISKALDILCENYAKSISLSLLSKQCGLSVSRLAHLFRDQVGITPQRFLEIQRLNRARQLLELTQNSVSEIAYEVGFQNPFYFSLRFKKHTRLNPRAYRLRNATIGRD
jgi:AraC family transcriptional regulator, arabinose operon regulatory protein